MTSSNCFQSVAYIFDFPEYWIATASTLIHHGREKIHDND
jgi:hypothetical protein